MIKVAVFGAGGRMGTEVCRAVAADDETELVAAIDPEHAGRKVSEVAGIDSPLVITDKPSVGAEVAIDFTVASEAVKNMRWCIENGVHAVVGTTGISESELSALRSACESSSANVLVAPNFAIGAVLMMRFAELAARWMPDAEVIELHHPGKLDAPSGTARSTAAAIAKARSADTTKAASKEIDPGARGGDVDGVRVHSVRLPGFVAHQEVIFGGAGQTLTIRHDSTDRTSFMPGVLLAVKKIDSLRGFTFGLEQLLGL